jgi:Ubiquitin carboxyl-terminal hydrolase
MNATLQALLASPVFCRYLSFMSIAHQRAQTLRHLTWLGQIMRGERELGSKRAFDQAISFIGDKLAETLDLDSDSQQDAHEFMVELLDTLQKDIFECIDDEQDVLEDLFYVTSSFLHTTCSRYKNPVQIEKRILICSFFISHSCEKVVSPSVQQVQSMYNIDMQDVKEDESIQSLIDKNLVVEFAQRCCQQDIEIKAQINCLPE